MSQNTYLRVLVLGGLRDLACPIDGIRYSLDHLQLDAAYQEYHLRRIRIRAHDVCQRAGLGEDAEGLGKIRDAMIEFQLEAGLIGVYSSPITNHDDIRARETPRPAIAARNHRRQLLRRKLSALRVLETGVRPAI